LTVVQPSADERALWRIEAAKAYPGPRGPFCPADLYDEVMRTHGEFRSRPKP
jgi:hypothetical protein